MSDADARCSYHHATPATALCTVCDKPVCEVCTREVNAAQFCSGCAVGRDSQKPWLAALFALLLPGAGQVYNGDVGKAVFVFFTGWLVLPWMYGIYDAATRAEAILRGAAQTTTVPTGWMLMGLKILWIPFATAYAFGAIFLLVTLAQLVSNVF